MNLLVTFWPRIQHLRFVGAVHVHYSAEDPKEFNEAVMKGDMKDPEGPSIQYLRLLVSKTILFMAFGTRDLKYWVLGPSGVDNSRRHRENLFDPHRHEGEIQLPPKVEIGFQ